MRVIAGEAKGRRLLAPKGDVTRPTSDFVREAVFNALQSIADLDGSTVVDLFAGSGAMGIEALSRGAASATFVDSDRRAAEAIARNLTSTRLSGGVVVRDDVLRWLSRGPGTFDLAFVDPPYAFDAWSSIGSTLDASVVVAESDRELDLGEQWEILRTKRYRTTVVTLFVARRPM